MTTEELSFTNVACRLLDGQTCRCRKYERRREQVPDCVVADPGKPGRASTGCRRAAPIAGVAEGKDLAWWHPLVSGDPDTVHRAGVSVRGRAVDERRAGMLENYIVDWPGQMPRTRKGQGR